MSKTLRILWRRGLRTLSLVSAAAVMLAAPPARSEGRLALPGRGTAARAQAYLDFCVIIPERIELVAATVAADHAARRWQVTSNGRITLLAVPEAGTAGVTTTYTSP